MEGGSRAIYTRMKKMKPNAEKTAAIQSGMRVGRWTVLDKTQQSSRGETKWLCRCECGTERYVLERSLLYGGSVSCGCFRLEQFREKVAYDLTGKTFGDLTVMCETDNAKKTNGVKWLCQCACGKPYETYGTLLVSGKRTHCGCRNDLKNYAYSDISGRKFNRLTALYPLAERTDRGGLIWHCRCDCGNEVDVSMNTLVYSKQMSCGCQKKEHDQLLSTFLTHVDGTCLDHLRSKKIPTSNTTGVRGVYLNRGKYIAKIVLQNKQYQLGTYKTLEGAAQARKDAEAAIDEQILQHYDKWLAKAQADPAWGEAHPVHYDISKRGCELEIVAEPSLREIENEAPEIPESIDFRSLRQKKKTQKAREKDMRRCSYPNNDSTPSTLSLKPKEKETTAASSTRS